MVISKKPKTYAAFIVFAAVILLLVFVASPIQQSLGIWGLLITELIIVACAVISALIFRYDIREVIPVKRPMLRQVFGVLLLWLGALLVGCLGSFITMLLFPEKMTALSKALGDYMTDGPFLLSLVITAVFPALCEETLCRGFIQYSLGGIRRKWLVIVIVGILFGLFHMSPLRYFPTMVLGFALAYIMAETKNIILPMILHFVNNGMSLSLSYAVGGTQTQTDTALVSQAAAVTIGIVFILCAVVPWLLIAGSRLLRTKSENQLRPMKNRQLVIAGVISAFCVLAGIVVTVIGAGSLLGSMKIIDMNMTEYVSVASVDPDSFPVIVEKDGNYQLSYVITEDPAADGKTHFSLADASGEEYAGITAESIYGNKQVFLPAGNYTLTYTYDYENTTPASVQINFMLINIPG